MGNEISAQAFDCPKKLLLKRLEKKGLLLLEIEDYLFTSTNCGLT